MKIGTLALEQTHHKNHLYIPTFEFLFLEITLNKFKRMCHTICGTNIKQ
jgi:hypothetical protein